MLRRAGTECLANLALSTPGARRITSAGRAGLWVSLLQDGLGEAASASAGGSTSGTEDEALACAVAGGLAMALGVLLGDADDEEQGQGQAGGASDTGAGDVARSVVGRLIDHGEHVPCKVVTMHPSLRPLG